CALCGTFWAVFLCAPVGRAPPPVTFRLSNSSAVLIVTLALLFWWRRTDLLDRSALACTIIAAGSSGLYGLGLNSITLQVVRLLFHFLANSLGVMAIIRWFQAKRMQSHMLVKVAA